MTRAIQTVAQRIQYQRAGLLVRLQLADPAGRVSGWTVWQSYAALFAALQYLMDRRVA